MGLTTAHSELLVADTTFVSVWHARSIASDATSHWPHHIVCRLSNARLSISVVTVAELRAGHLKAR